MAAHRREHWPEMAPHERAPGLVQIYDVVRRTGLPNAMSARVPVPSNLNIKAWEHYLGTLGNKGHILDFVRYGFPTGYAGPISDTADTPNHPSATNFPSHIDEFVEKELALGGLVGPYDSPPFAPRCHVSPLCRAKKGTRTRGGLSPT